MAKRDRTIEQQKRVKQEEVLTRREERRLRAIDRVVNVERIRRLNEMQRRHQEVAMRSADDRMERMKLLRDALVDERSRVRKSVPHFVYIFFSPSSSCPAHLPCVRSPLLGHVDAEFWFASTRGHIPGIPLCQPYASPRARFTGSLPVRRTPQHYHVPHMLT